MALKEYAKDEFEVTHVLNINNFFLLRYKIHKRAKASWLKEP